MLHGEMLCGLRVRGDCLRAKLQRACTRLGDLPVLERAHSADAYPADDDIFNYQGQSAISRDYTGKGEVYESSAQYRIFRGFGRTLESNSGVGFCDGSFDAAELCVVTALQVEQMTAVIHDGDNYLPLV